MRPSRPLLNRNVLSRLNFSGISSSPYLLGREECRWEVDVEARRQTSSNSEKADIRRDYMTSKLKKKFPPLQISSNISFIFAKRGGMRYFY